MNISRNKDGNVEYVLKKSNGTVMDSFIMTVKKAATIFGNDWDGFFDATDYVFTGYFGHGAGTMWMASRSEFHGYFDGASGFKRPDFYDESNQVRHFWVALASAADPYGDNPLGEGIAIAGNNWHDWMWDTWPGEDDVTVMDYKLSVTGVDIAKQIGSEIKTPSDLPEILDYRLSVSGPGYIGPYLNPASWFTPWD